MSKKYELTQHLQWLGKRLSQLRNDMNMTQKEFAEYLGIPQCRVSHIENGGVDLKLSTLLKICSKVGIPPQLMFPDGKEASWR